jgi:hypothetical protein
MDHPPEHPNPEKALEERENKNKRMKDGCQKRKSRPAAKRVGVDTGLHK